MHVYGHFVEKKEVVWTGNFLDFGGYSQMNRSFAKGLIDKGWKLGIEAIRGTIDLPSEEVEYWNSMRLFDEHGRPQAYLDHDIVRVVAFLPLKRVPPTRHNVIYTMMETEKVNAPFIARSNQFYQSCWTPTEYNAKVFKEAGMEIPCKVIPIGIDSSYNKDNVFTVRPNFKVYGHSNSPELPSGFKFLSIFRWSYRKGYDVLIRSYLEEFKRSDDVSLIIFSRHAAMSHRSEFYEAVERDINALYDKYGHINSPPIYHCADVIPQSLMPSVYALGDVFIITSRGEGFGLPALEASSMGLPLIAPYHTGFTDYVREDNCYKFDVDEWVVCNDIPEWTGWITRDFFGQRFPRFGEKTVADVRKLMRKSAENQQDGKQKNEKMQELIADKYSYNTTVDKVDAALRSLL